MDDAVTKLTGMFSVNPIEKVLQSANVKLSDHSSSDDGRQGTMSFKAMLAKASESYTEEETLRSGCYTGLAVEVLPTARSVFDRRG